MKKSLFTFVLLVSVLTSFSVKATPYHLKQLTTSNGLSQQDVECIIQDKFGYIWIASYDGLNRYDGDQVTVFRHNPSVENSIVDNRVKALARWDERDEIWIGTEGRGLCSYNLRTERFTSYCMENSDRIKTLAFHDGKLWFGGLNLVGYLTFTEEGLPQFSTYNLSGASRNSIEVFDIVFDSRNNVVVGTSSGIFIKTPSSDTFQIQFRKSEIKDLFADHKGNLWCLTKDQIYFFALQNQIINDYLKSPQEMLAPEMAKMNLSSISQLTDNTFLLNTTNKIFKMSVLDGRINLDELEFSTTQFFESNSIRNTFIDHTMNVWITSSVGGVAFFDLNQKKIYGGQLLDKRFGNHFFVQNILKDDTGGLWIGTSRGLFVGKDSHGLKDGCCRLVSDPVFGLALDHRHNVWSTVKHDILFFPEGDVNRVVSLLKKFNLEKKYSIEGPYTIHEDAERGIVWVGMRSGILEFRTDEKGHMNHEFYGADIFNLPKISNITGMLYLKDRNSLLVITAYSGIYEVKLTDDGRLFRSEKLKYSSPSKYEDHAWSILKASNGRIYMGTDSGLREFVLEDGKFVIHLIHHEDVRLNTLKIPAITEDCENNLWLNTGQGLLSYNLNSEETKFYTCADGLTSSTLSEGALFDPDQHLLYVGGYKGFSVVDLHSLFLNEIPPQTVLRSIKINNQLIRTGQKYNKRVILPVGINYTSALKLKYNENNISFDFASLHYSTPDKKFYAYKLEGFDDEWVKLGNTHSVTFTNLPKGDYVLRVSSANGDGVWNKHPVKLNISIAAAPWTTGWAYMGYLLFVGIVIFLVYRYLAEKRRVKQEYLLEQLEQEKKLEIAEIKLKYHTNITHELRTPLSLIVAPTQELLDKKYKDDFLNMRLQSIKNNTDRLLQLIGQFLDLRKVMSDKYDLHVSCNRVDKAILQIKQNFEPLAIQKQIILNLYYDANITYCWCDIEVINKICYNLLSNALKYTHAGGQVSIYVSSDLEMKLLKISVEDTGEGVDESELDHIFERFYQTPGANGGTGIGLHLCKHLVDLHHGTIDVVSRKNEGSIFTIELPVEKSAFSESEITETAEPQEIISKTMEDEPEVHEPGHELVLVVEDNVELREYLRSSLSDDYDVIVAENGEMGYKMAVNRIPSLVVSDVMMPVMDGIEFLKLSKANILTSHIPFLLLTAKDTIDNEIEGLSEGADDYITKPFSMQSLKLKIRNMVKLTSCRNEVKHEEEKEGEPTVPELNERDLKFITEFKEIVIQNLSTPEFSIEDVCRIMCVSRMQLHRKMNAILSKKPSQFIKEIRMEKAFELIAKKGYNITETMQEVGYTNHSYFSKLFFEVNHVYPRDLMNRNKA